MVEMVRRADDRGVENLIGAAIFEDAVLMDARFVRERVRADDGLVFLDRHAGRVATAFDRSASRSQRDARAVYGSTSRRT